MQTSDDYLETLEAEFKEQTQTESDAPESFLFNRFIHTQMALLFNSPDNIEDINQHIKRSREAMASDANDQEIDPNLYAKIKQSKAKHKALFDFVRKHQNHYSVDPQLLADFKVVEEFTEPIQTGACVVHEGQTLPADKFFALDNVDPAKRDSVRIGIFEQTEAQAVRRTLKNLPGTQAIQNIPSAIQTFRKLQELYRAFIHDYPDHEERSEMEAKLAASQRLYDTFPAEYLKAQPSKKEIERIAVSSFLRKIGYNRELQARFDAIAKSESLEEKLAGLMHIESIGKAIKDYKQKHPTLEAEHSDFLGRAADQILVLFSESDSD